MPRINKTKYAILGMLSIGPMSGYDIKKSVDKSLRFFWRENYGHIYPILERLANEGLIKKDKDTGEKSRKEYSLTRKGRESLVRWLREPAVEQSIRNELLLKLFFGNHLETGEAIALIEAERERNRALLEVYGDIERKIHEHSAPESEYWLLTLDYGKRYSAMALEWCDEASRRMISIKKNRRTH